MSSQEQQSQANQEETAYIGDTLGVFRRALDLYRSSQQ
jgi:hypothetical protein